MARASRLHRGGWGFESLSAHFVRPEYSGLTQCEHAPMALSVLYSIVSGFAGLAQW